MRDADGAELALGDRVTPAGTDRRRIPAGAVEGVVTGFGRSQVHVRWDGYRYDPHRPFHYVPRPTQLRRITRGAT